MAFILGMFAGVLLTVASIGFVMMYEDNLDSDEDTGGWGV